MLFTGKSVVITGGTHGIGEAMVKRFAKEGANILFTYKSDTSKAQEMSKTLSTPRSRVIGYQCDITDLSTCHTLMAMVREVFGKLDILINNVAALTRNNFLSIDEKTYDYVMDVNLKAPFFMIQSAAKLMIQSNIKGSIINISSLSALRCRSKVTHYQISKAGLENLTKSAAYELAEYGIRVNSICPGLTATKANRDQWSGNPELWQERAKHIPLNRTGVAEDHAGAALFLASDDSAWVTGTSIVIDGGMALF